MSNQQQPLLYQQPQQYQPQQQQQFQPQQQSSCPSGGSWNGAGGSNNGMLGGANAAGWVTLCLAIVCVLIALIVLVVFSGKKAEDSCFGSPLIPAWLYFITALILLVYAIFLFRRFEGFEGFKSVSNKRRV